MTVIQRSALVPHSIEQMFALVNQVEDYPRFLPWCHKSEILQRLENEVVAKLEIAYGGVHKSFTTRNILYPHHQIDICLVSGPFKKLTGHWSFKALDEQSCKVSLNLEFELAGNILDRAFIPLFQRIFHHIVDKLVDAFCKRAQEVYGQN